MRENETEAGKVRWVRPDGPDNVGGPVGQRWGRTLTGGVLSVFCSFFVRVFWDTQLDTIWGESGLVLTTVTPFFELLSRFSGTFLLVLGKFGLVQSGALFAGLETGQSGPPRNFWDRDRDRQGPSISVWSWSRPSPDLDRHIYSVFFVI